MAARRIDPRAVKLQRCYDTGELAALLRVHKNTVRHWQRAGLTALDGGRPVLFAGCVVRAFLASRNASRKSPCSPGTLYCFRCRAPRPPALGMIERRGLGLDVLLRGKFLLRRAVEAKVRALRVARGSLGERLLFELPDAAVVEPAHAFHFNPNIYPAAALYQGSLRFPKHFYPRPAAMNGEETECAVAIDLNPAVVRWVRNVERAPLASLWFPTATDRFYPDFVAELDGGRVLVIEYKGANLFGTPDTVEKDAIGRGWAGRSSGRCLFLTASKRLGAPPLDVQIAATIASEPHGCRRRIEAR